MKSKFCAINREAIMAADDELPPEVVQHCERCADCREFARLWNRFRSVKPSERIIPAAVESRIKAAARQHCRRRPLLRMRIFAVAAAVLVLLIGAATIRGRQLAAERRQQTGVYLEEWDWSGFEQESLALTTALSLGEVSLPEYGE
ncbi:hypothetical protein [Victivallis sp. Marseille-Q1083]|uniref:hypothetical protein n=1 Tax=Victivallis sp. Marseille-Q1083 TaxID=2717288 RepID=UPI001588F390|nr:hypothetical protein [Victivallis sp. Marseille-Q1083]